MSKKNSNMSDCNTSSNSILRKLKYQELLNKGEEIKSRDIPNDEKVSEVKEIVKEANKLHAQEDIAENMSTVTTERLMDTQVLKMSHEVVQDVYNNLSPSKFSEDEYANAILKLTLQEDGTQNWDKIAEMACEVFRTARFSSSLVGAFDGEVNTEANSKLPRTTNKETAKEKTAENVLKFDEKKDGIGKVEDYMKQIRMLCLKSENNSIPFYKLVIDPDSIMDTAQNVFQVAQLLKENRIVLQTGSDGYPSVSVYENQSNLNNKGDKIQDLCCIDMALQRKMIDFYKIEKPLLNFNY